MAAPKQAPRLTGLVTLNMDYSPSTPRDVGNVLARLGVQSIEVVKNYTIKSEQDFAEVGEILKVVTERVNQITGEYEESAALAFQAHRQITGDRAAELAPWTAIKDHATRQLTAYLDRKKAERRAQELEDQRKADEEQRRLNAEAQAAKADGEIGKARELTQAAMYVPAPIVRPAVAPKAEGISTSGTWKGRLKEPSDENLMVLIKAIAAGRVPLTHIVKLHGAKEETRESLLAVDERVLTAIAKRMEATFNIPGCEAYEASGVRVSLKGNSSQGSPVLEKEIEEDWKP